MTNDTQEIDADALRARLAETPTADEVDYLDELLSRQHAILTGVANALRGDPGPIASHSHHDLAERAAAMVALLAVTRSSLEAARTGERITVVDEIERLQRELAAAREIIEGRTVPPTDAEIVAHWRAGGTWIVEGVIVLRVVEAVCARRDQASWAAVTWLPLDRSRRPCAWPVGGLVPHTSAKITARR